ncbi:hypothetical protein ACLOJK_028081 [Asimina triloba]
MALIDLADIIGVDLYHVEKHAKEIVANNAELMLIQGEIISQTYWDMMAEEINERLQECSQIALAELAAQLHVSSELISTVVEPRLGTLIKGRLEGGQLYTPAYVERITAMVRGAARGITVLTNLSTVWSSLQQLLLEVDGANGVSVESAFFQTLFNGLVKKGEILGSIRAGAHWTPAVFAHAQKESVDSFFSQNSFISYDVLHKLAISQPKQYLQVRLSYLCQGHTLPSRFPEGIPLDTVFVHPSMIEMSDAAVEDAVERGSWIDCLSVLPAVFGGQDASKLLSLCPFVQRAMKYAKATILGESFVFSNTFIKDVFDLLDKETEILDRARSSGQGLIDSVHSVSGNSGGHDPALLPEGNETVDGGGGGGKHVMEKGPKKKRGKATGSSKAVAVESNSDLENLPAKSKKNQRKNKDSSSLQVPDAKSSSKKYSDDAEESIISEVWIIQKTLQLFPDFEELGGQDDPDTFLRPLAIHLRPMLLTSWKERRNRLFTESSDKRRRLLDNLQKKMDESFLDLQLYEKALDLFEDDQAASDMDSKLKNGIEVEESQCPEPTPLTAGDRISLAKRLPGSLSAKAVAAVEALEGKRLDTFLNALGAVAEESGLLLKKLDKKLERTLLHSYRKELLPLQPEVMGSTQGNSLFVKLGSVWILLPRPCNLQKLYAPEFCSVDVNLKKGNGTHCMLICQDLTSQVSSETDPVALLPKVVSLLYLQVYNKALQAPGRAISVAISRLKRKMEDSAHKFLMDYHAATVALLALLSAATEDEEDCTADRIQSKRELLESQMPELKALVLNTKQT